MDFIQQFIDFINTIIQKIKDFVDYVHDKNDNNSWGEDPAEETKAN